MTLTSEQNHRSTSHSLSFAEPSELLGGGGFDAHVALGQFEQAGDAFTHGWIMRRQLRPLRHQSYIDIDDLEPLAPHDPQHLAKELGAGNSFIMRIAIGEMRADIPFTHCSQ